jgi:hypothetical protein
MTDLFQKIHVGVKANAKGEYGDLLAPVGLVDRLNDLLLDGLASKVLNFYGRNLQIFVTS